MAAVPAVVRREDGSREGVLDYQPLRMRCPAAGEGVSHLDEAVYHDMKYDHAEPDPYPEASLAKRQRLEMLDIRPAVTVYKETEE